jgi:hypothetical protein
MKKCKTCYGYGIWAIGEPRGVGPMDASDGVPTKKCPECGAGPPYWRTAEGKIIPMKPDHEEAFKAKLSLSSNDYSLDLSKIFS